MILYPKKVDMTILEFSLLLWFQFQDRTIYDPNTTFASKCYVLFHLFVSIIIVTQLEAQVSKLYQRA